jgi:hypothetical protein
MHNSEPVQSEPPFKEVTVIPSISTMGGSWGDLAQAAPAEPKPAPDPDSTLPAPTTRLPDDDELVTSRPP